MASLAMHMPNAEIWKAGLRTAVAGGLAFAIAQIFNLPQGYWAVLTAIVIMQTRVGASLKAAADRVLGTLVGAAFGFVVAMLTPVTPAWTLLGLLFSIGVLGMLAAARPNYRVAPMTAAILLISTPSHEIAMISAAHRVVEIMIGCAVGVLVSLAVAPARSDTILRSETNHVLTLLAQMIGLAVAGQTRQSQDEAISKISEQIYASYGKIDTLAKEAREEHASHVSHGALDLDRLRLCLRDLRTSTFVLRRVTRQHWPASLGDAMVAPTQAVTDAIRSYLVAVGDALSAQAVPPPADSLEDAFATFSAAKRSLVGHASPTGAGAEGSVVANEDTGEGASAYIGNYSFALEQVRYSIEKLAECVSDAADTPEKS
jgi:uncharacterized membrane protein YccC